MGGAAAELAGRLRAERAAIVADIEGGVLPVASIGQDARAAAVKVVVLAQSIPGVGKVRSRRVLDALAIDEAARWGELTPAVEARVVAALEEAATAPAG